MHACALALVEEERAVAAKGVAEAAIPAGDAALAAEALDGFEPPASLLPAGTCQLLLPSKAALYAQGGGPEGGMGGIIEASLDSLVGGDA